MKGDTLKAEVAQKVNCKNYYEKQFLLAFLWSQLWVYCFQTTLSVFNPIHFVLDGWLVVELGRAVD